MTSHTCDIDDMRILGSRPNPLDPTWSEWTLVVCTACSKLYEWQHHSEDQMHGGDLEISAIVTRDYLRHIYGLDPADVPRILNHARKMRVYDRYKMEFREEDA